MSKEKYTTKREVESFLNEYWVDRVKLNDDIDLNESAMLSKVLHNVVDSERPDGYSIVDDKYYIVEHFQFDASKCGRKGSKLMEDTFAVRNGAKEEGHTVADLKPRSCLEYYWGNLKKNFEIHALNIEEYKQKEVFKGKEYGGCIFLIEDKMLFGVIKNSQDEYPDYTKREKYFEIVKTKEFADLWKQYGLVDFVVFAGIGYNGKYYYTYPKRICDETYPELKTISVTILNEAHMNIWKAKFEL